MFNVESERGFVPPGLGVYPCTAWPGSLQPPAIGITASSGEKLWRRLRRLCALLVMDPGTYHLFFPPCAFRTPGGNVPGYFLPSPSATGPTHIDRSCSQTGVEARKHCPMRGQRFRASAPV